MLTYLDLTALYPSTPLTPALIHTMSGPPTGASAGARPSSEQIAMFKQAGIRKLFIADISGGLGPYVLGYELHPLPRHQS